MRIAITSSDYQNPYAYAIAQALRQAGYSPVGFLVQPTSQLKKIQKYLKHQGLYLTFIRLFKNENSIVRVQFIIKYLKDNLLSTKDPSISNFARQHDIRILTAQFKSQKAARWLANNVDVVVNAGGGIFPTAFIHAPRLGVINIHMGELPQFRGLHTFEWSIFERKPLRITIHWIVSKLDLGDIISVRDFIPDKGLALDAIKEQSIAVRLSLLIQTIKRLDAGSIRSVKQKRSEGRQYYAMHPRLREITQMRYYSES